LRKILLSFAIQRVQNKRTKGKYLEISKISWKKLFLQTRTNEKYLRYMQRPARQVFVMVDKTKKLK